MTILLDIAALFALLLALTFVPVLGLRHEARITRALRKAREREESERAAAHPQPRPAAGPATRTDSGTAPAPRRTEPAPHALSPRGA